MSKMGVSRQHQSGLPLGRKQPRPSKPCTVCGKWTLHIDDALIESIKPGKRTDLALEAVCYEFLANKINPDFVKSIVEHHSGLGLRAVINHYLFRPLKCQIFDQCASTFLQSLLEQYRTPQIFVLQKEDPLSNLGLILGDLIIADFHSFTLRHHKLQPARLTKVFSNNPRYVILTDSAVGKFHLNKAMYDKLAGVKLKNIKHYFQQYQFRGYGIKAAATHHNAGYILFEKNFAGDFELLKLKATKKLVDYGFKIGAHP